MNAHGTRFPTSGGAAVYTAEFLLNNGYTLDALYLAGYAVECALKSLILDLTPSADRREAFHRLKGGAKMHYPERLKEELQNLGYSMPLALVKRFRRFDWSTDLRYETGRRPVGEVQGYLKLAKAVMDWGGEGRIGMGPKTTPLDWEHRRTDESRHVEEVLRQHFQEADAYRYNSASLRVRITDLRFKGKSREQRDDMVEPALAALDPDTQADIMNIVLLYPNEVDESFRAQMNNEEFEHPSESML